MVLQLVKPEHPLALYDAYDEAYEMRKSFKLFAKQAWAALEPGTPLLWNWHLDVICDHLQAVYERRIKRLAVTLAPGHAKSTFISQLFPDWCWLNNPYLRFLCASHSLDLAIRDNKYRRDLVESEWFQERYSTRFTLSSSQNVKSYFENDYRGYMMAVAVRSSGTGKRCDLSIIDDANNAMSKLADILDVKEWFGKTWIPRLNDQENGPMIVVGQRLDERDLIGHILKLGGWEHVNLPEEYEPARASQTSLGAYDIRTVEGQLLWPEKFPRETLDNLKRGLGAMHYAAQYQQSPMPAGGGMFQQKWFRYFEETEQAYLLYSADRTPKAILKSQCRTFGTIDLAISSKQSADYTVMCVWAITPEHDLLLLHVLRDRLSNAEQLSSLHVLNSRFHPDFWKVETVAYQLAFFQQAVAEGIPCKEYKPTRDKVSRASTASVWSQNGKSYTRQGASWLAEWEAEHLSFPKGSHDDQVDNHGMAADEVCTPHGPLIWSPDTWQEADAPTSVPVRSMVTIDDPPAPEKLPSFYDWDFDQGTMIDLEVNR